jgi:glycosyltransferase involved in cell wall biosynthesis
MDFEAGSTAKGRPGKPVLLWDATKTGNPKYPASGMKQVAIRLRLEVEALGYEVWTLRWSNNTREFQHGNEPIPRGSHLPFLSPEIYCADERPGILEWLDYHEGTKAAIFYDDIPMKHPAITWPKSVYRHPDYMKMLGTHFTKILAISNSSQADLLDYWKSLELQSQPMTTALQLGSDLHFQLRPEKPSTATAPSPPWNLLMVGILEPRKNHQAAISACEKLYAQGHKIHLHIAGRLNPHFGKPILSLIKEARAKGLPITWHKSPKPQELLALYRKANLCLFPSFAEGCGLPVLESLWMGTPVLASSIPSVMENAHLGGVRTFDINNPGSLYESLRALLQSSGELAKLRESCHQGNLPTWRDSAVALSNFLLNSAS